MIFDSLEIKEKILAQFLEIAAFEGWTNEALAQAVAKCDIDPKYTEIIFENGLLDIADFYLESQNQKVAVEISKIENFHFQKIRDKIRLALYARFEVEKTHKIALQRLINFYLNFKNFGDFEIGIKPMSQGFKACFKISDFIWKLINDQSTDFNFYTKRLTLAKIIFRSLLIFLKDEKDNLQKTKSFIDSQIEGVMRFEKRKSQIKNYSKKIFFDEEGHPKSPKQLIKNLPFIRLFR